MQIENEVIQFINMTRSDAFKSLLSDLQIQYLAQLENKSTLQDVVLNGLKNGWLVNFVQLYDLMQKLVENKLIHNKNIYDYFTGIRNQAKDSQPKIPDHLSNRTPAIKYKKDFPELVKLPFLRSLSPEMAELLLDQSEIIEYPAESFICKKDDIFSRYLYILLSGEAAIYGQGSQTKKFIRLLKANSVFGEMGFFLGMPRTADIIAVRQSKVLVINGNSESMNAYLHSDKAQHLVHRFWIQQALVNSEIFKKVPSESIDELTFGGQISKIDANTVLFSEGDKTDGAYIVVQGSFSVQINSKIVAKISQGQMIGEISLFQTQGKRSATITAEQNSVLMQISLQKFYQLLSQNLYLAKIMQEISQKRFDENQRSTDKLSAKS
jgi:CRP-like cAMP-binding protein